MNDWWKRKQRKEARQAAVVQNSVQQNSNVNREPQMPKTKGGRLEAKVISASKTDFTIKIQAAKGHEDSEKEITLPLSDWNGAGAEVGGKLDYDAPARGPRLNDSVFYDSSRF